MQLVATTEVRALAQAIFACKSDSRTVDIEVDELQPLRS